MKPCDYKKEEETNLFGLILIGVVSFFTIPTRWLIKEFKDFSKYSEAPWHGDNWKIKYDNALWFIIIYAMFWIVMLPFDLFSWTRKRIKNERGDNADTP